MLKNRIEDRIKLLEGDYGIYYKDLSQSNDFFIGNTDEFVAAGIVKLFILLEAMRHVTEGITPENQIFILRDEHKAPSIGALTHLHEGLELHFSDLYHLMASVSDNTATNMLIDYLGIHEINHTLRQRGLHNSTIRRRFFDDNAIELGLENTFSLKEVGRLLEDLYQGQVFSGDYNQKMLNILKSHQRDYVMSYYFRERLEVAHQMGEEEVDGITHDVGIVFAEKPFILCMATQNVNTEVAQNIMRDIALMCYEASQD